MLPQTGLFLHSLPRLAMFGPELDNKGVGPCVVNVSLTAEDLFHTQTASSARPSLMNPRQVAGVDTGAFESL